MPSSNQGAWQLPTSPSNPTQSSTLCFPSAVPDKKKKFQIVSSNTPEWAIGRLLVEFDLPVSQLVFFKFAQENKFYSRLKWDPNPASVVYSLIMWYMLQDIDAHLSLTVSIILNRNLGTFQCLLCTQAEDPVGPCGSPGHFGELRQVWDLTQSCLLQLLQRLAGGQREKPCGCCQRTWQTSGSILPTRVDPTKQRKSSEQTHVGLWRSLKSLLVRSCQTNRMSNETDHVTTSHANWALSSGMEVSIHTDIQKPCANAAGWCDFWLCPQTGKQGP